MPRKNARRVIAPADHGFFDARADLIERAYKRAVEYLLMTGEGEDDKRFYANVAFHLVEEVRRAPPAQLPIDHQWRNPALSLATAQPFCGAVNQTAARTRANFKAAWRWR